MKKERKKRQEQTVPIIDFKQAIGDVRDTFASSTTLLMSSLTCGAAFAWRDFASALFERYKEKLSGWGETFGLFLYATLITLVIVLIIQRLKKIQKVVGGKSIKKESKRVKEIQ